MPAFSRGFSLIEVMVVLVIIGIAASAATVFVSFGGPEKQLKDTVEKFVVIAEHVSELAVLGGEPIGLMLEPPQWRENPLEMGWQYSWHKMPPPPLERVWKPITELPAVDLPNSMELLVFVDEQEWSYERAPKIRLPIVVFYPSGEVTPFEIEFTDEQLPGESETLLVDVWGSVVWKAQQEAQQQRDELLEQFSP